MRTRKLFAESFFGRTKVVSPKLKCVLHEINLPCVTSSLDDEVDLDAGPKW